MSYLFSRAFARPLVAGACVLGLAVGASSASASQVRSSHTTATASDFRHAAKAGGLNARQTRIFVRYRNDARTVKRLLGARTMKQGVLRTSARGSGARIASAGYPFPTSFGSKSTSGSTLSAPVACFFQDSGGASDSYGESVAAQLIWVAAYRGQHGGITWQTTGQQYSTYDVSCWVYARYYDGFNLQERLTHYGHSFGHGTAVTGRREDGRTGIVPFYNEGSPSNGNPKWVCNSGEFSSTQAGC